MRHNLRLATLLAMLLVAHAFGQTLSAARFQIRIPPELKPETASVTWSTFDSSGKMTGFLESGEIRAGDDYSLPLGNAPGLRVLIYIPGYQMVARDFKDAALAAGTFVPPLRQLPITRLDGRLVDSSNQPVRNQTMSLTYGLHEAILYFYGNGVFDGRVPTLLMGGTRTDDTGAFTFDVPSLRDDPFFQKYSHFDDKTFYLISDGRKDSGMSGCCWPDDTLQPNTFSAQGVFEKPFVVVKATHGTLSGSLGRNFLDQNGLTGDLARYVESVPHDETIAGRRVEVNHLPLVQLWAASAKGGYNAMLKADGTFEVQLAPGSYDLNLSIPGREVSVEKGVVVEEGKRRVVQRP